MDFILRRMMEDVDKWYELNFYPMNYKGPKGRKMLHLDMLHKNYDYKDFEGLEGEQLGHARAAYLTKTQETVNLLQGVQ